MEQKHKKNVSCSECKRTFKNEIVVWTHIAYEHTNQSSRRSRVFNSAKAQISCTACQKSFESEAEFDRHLEKVKVKETNTANVARKIITDSQLTQVVQPKNNVNTDTDKLIQSKSPKSKELTETAKCSTYKIYCALCRKRFNSENALWTHVAFKHVRQEQDSCVAVQIVCDNCKQVFNSLDKVNEHLHSSADKSSTNNENSAIKSNETPTLNSKTNLGSRNKSSISHSSLKTKKSIKKSNIKNNRKSPKKIDKCSDSASVLTVERSPPKLVPNPCYVPEDASKILNDSFEGQEGIHVIYDDENDDFEEDDGKVDFIEDEEYSEIDSFLESSKEVAEQEEEDYMDSGLKSNETSLVISKGGLYMNHKDQDANIIEISKHKGIAEISKDEEITEISKDEEITEISKDEEITEVSKDEEITEVSKDEEITEIRKDVDKIEISKDAKIAKRTKAESQYVEKVEKRKETAIEEDNFQQHEFDDTSDQALLDKNTCDVAMSNKIDESYDSENNDESANEDEEAEESETSTSSKDVSLSDLFEDEGQYQDKVSLLTSMLTNELLSSRVRYLESKVEELKLYMERLIAEEEEENKVISECVEPLQCDIIESTTGSFDVGDEVITCMDDDAVYEVEVNTSEANDVNIEMLQEDECNLNSFGVYGETSTKDQSDKTDSTKQPFQTITILENQEPKDQVKQNTLQEVGLKGTETESLGTTDQSSELKTLLDGESLDSVVTFLNSDNIQDDTLEMDSVVFEHIRNGYISSQELDSLFTTTAVDHPS